MLGRRPVCVFPGTKVLRLFASVDGALQRSSVSPADVQMNHHPSRLYFNLQLQSSQLCTASVVDDLRRAFISPSAAAGAEAQPRSGEQSASPAATKWTESEFYTVRGEAKL